MKIRELFVGNISSLEQAERMRAAGATHLGVPWRAGDPAADRLYEAVLSRFGADILGVQLAVKDLQAWKDRGLPFRSVDLGARDWERRRAQPQPIEGATVRITGVNESDEDEHLDLNHMEEEFPALFTPSFSDRVFVVSLFSEYEHPIAYLRKELPKYLKEVDLEAGNYKQPSYFIDLARDPRVSINMPWRHLGDLDWFVDAVGPGLGVSVYLGEFKKFTEGGSEWVVGGQFPHRDYTDTYYYLPDHTTEADCLKLLEKLK